MEITEKKESDNNTQAVDSAESNNKEVEERQARDLKANLHPLKVFFFFFSFFPFCLSIYMHG